MVWLTISACLIISGLCGVGLGDNLAAPYTTMKEAGGLIPMLKAYNNYLFAFPVIDDSKKTDALMAGTNGLRNTGLTGAIWADFNQKKALLPSLPNPDVSAMFYSSLKPFVVLFSVTITLLATKSDEIIGDDHDMQILFNKTVTGGEIVKAITAMRVMQETSRVLCDDISLICQTHAPYTECSHSTMRWCGNTCKWCDNNRPVRTVRNVTQYFGESDNAEQVQYVHDETDGYRAAMKVRDGNVTILAKEYIFPLIRSESIRAVWPIRGADVIHPSFPPIDDICVNEACEQYELSRCKTLLSSLAQHSYEADIEGKGTRMLVLASLPVSACDHFDSIWSHVLMKECVEGDWGAQQIITFRGTLGWMCPKGKCEFAVGSLRPLVINLLGTTNYKVNYNGQSHAGQIKRTKIIHLDMPDKPGQDSLLRIICGDLRYSRQIHMTITTLCYSSYPNTFAGNAAATLVCKWFFELMVIVFFICILILMWGLNKITQGYALFPIAVVLIPFVYIPYKLLFKYLKCSKCGMMKLFRHRCGPKCVCGKELGDAEEMKFHMELCAEVNNSTFKRILRLLTMTNIIWIMAILIISQVVMILIGHIWVTGSLYEHAWALSSGPSTAPSSILIFSLCTILVRRPKIIAIMGIILISVQVTSAASSSNNTGGHHKPSINEADKAAAAQWMKTVKEVLSIDTTALTDAGFHPASLEIKNTGIIYSGLTLTDTNDDGEFVTGTIMAMLPVAEGSAIGYNIYSPDGTDHIPIIIYMKSTSVLRKYEYIYSTYPPTTFSATQSNPCYAPCKKCNEQLKVKPWQASTCGENANMWGCEAGPWCLGVGIGSFCVSCSQSHDPATGAEIFKFISQEPKVEVCVKLNSHTFCRSMDRIDTLDSKRLGILMTSAVQQADIVSKKYVVLRLGQFSSAGGMLSKITAAIVGVKGHNILTADSNQVYRYGEDPTLIEKFGTPQYRRDEKGEVFLMNFHADIKYASTCHDLRTRDIVISNCFKGTHILMNNFADITYQVSYNYTDATKYMMLLLQRDIYAGTATVKMNLKGLIFKKMETTVTLTLTLEACAGCSSCDLGLSCVVIIKSTGIGRVKITCTGATPRHPEIGIAKRGTTRIIKILDTNQISGTVKCGLYSLDTKLATSSIDYKVTAGDPKIYTETKAKPLLVTNIIAQCNFICKIKGYFSFGGLWSSLKAIGIILMCALIFGVSGYALLQVVRLVRQVKPGLSKLASEYKSEQFRKSV